MIQPSGDGRIVVIMSGPVVIPIHSPNGLPAQKKEQVAKSLDGPHSFMFFAICAHGKKPQTAITMKGQWERRAWQVTGRLMQLHRALTEKDGHRSQVWEKDRGNQVCSRPHPLSYCYYDHWALFSGSKWRYWWQIHLWRVFKRKLDKTLQKAGLPFPAGILSAETKADLLAG